MSTHCLNNWFFDTLQKMNVLVLFQKADFFLLCMTLLKNGLPNTLTKRDILYTAGKRDSLIISSKRNVLIHCHKRWIFYSLQKKWRLDTLPKKWCLDALLKNGMSWYSQKPDVLIIGLKKDVWYSKKRTSLRTD